MVWIDVDPFYVFHFMNAYEDVDRSDRRRRVPCQRPCPRPSATSPLPDANIRPYLWRWEIDPVAGTVADRQLDDRTGDFPRINDAHNGKPYRYGYQAHTRSWDQGEGVRFDGVIQFDHARRHHQRRTSTDRTTSAASPSSRPIPTARRRTTGGCVNFVTDLADGTTEFVVLDARDVAAGPVARVQLPRRVPFGFHGNWMPATDRAAATGRRPARCDLDDPVAGRA